MPMVVVLESAPVQMTGNATNNRLTPLAWVVVFLVSGFLECDQVATMLRVGLFGVRPPLSVVHTRVGWLS